MTEPTPHELARMHALAALQESANRTCGAVLSTETGDTCVLRDGHPASHADKHGFIWIGSSDD